MKIVEILKKRLLKKKWSFLAECENVNLKLRHQNCRWSSFFCEIRIFSPDDIRLTLNDQKPQWDSANNNEFPQSWWRCYFFLLNLLVAADSCWIRRGLLDMFMWNPKLIDQTSLFTGNRYIFRIRKLRLSWVMTNSKPSVCLGSFHAISVISLHF